MKYVQGIVVVLILMSMNCAWAQPFDATRHTDVIGRICKTGEHHPPPTTDVNYGTLDYAVCGPGGLRVFPLPSVASDFNRIKFGLLGKKPGGEVVYLHGRMKMRVMPEFKTPAGWRPRFRHAWLEVDQMKRGVSFNSRPKVKKKGDRLIISVELKNPLNKPISGTEVVLALHGAQYLQPFRKAVPLLAPGEKKTVTFEVLAGGGKPKGELTIKNYGRIYIDIVEEI